jgi:hypothetical protein
MADGLLASGLNYIDQQKQALAARLGLLMNNPQEFAAQLGSEARQRAGVGLLGEPRTAQEMASGAWINSPYGQQAMQAGSGFAGTINPTKRIYRGSYDESPMYKVEENYKGNDIFGGVFGSGELQSAKSHGGGSVYYTDIPENQILKQQDLNSLPITKVKNALLKARPDLKNDKNLFDKVYDIVINDKNTFEYPDEVIKNAFKKSDLSEASFEAQRLRGQVSKNLGYKAVEMVDEHGISYLVSPNAEFTQLYKSKPVTKSVANKPIISSSIDPNTPIQKRQRGVFNK